MNETEEKNLRDLKVWQRFCDQILAKSFPPLSSDFSEDEIERDGRLNLSKFTNWEIICEEILDTQHSHIYYGKCCEELTRRGKSDQDIFEMRRFAWLTAGWLNYAVALREWVRLDEKDILLAIKWLYEEKQISKEKWKEFEDFVKQHA